MSWYVFELRQKYTGQTSRKQFYDRLRNLYNKQKQHIYMCLSEKNIGMNYYVFVYEEDIISFWKTLRKDKSINEQYGYNRVLETQINLLRQDIQYIREQISFGDVVKILQGKYSKLYGIVLRQRQNNTYQIGLKFCHGVCTEIIKGNQLQIVGNIFNYVKVSK